MKDIMSLGMKFFIIQISLIVIYQTNNFIIAQISGPQDVTIYNISYRYMSLAFMIFTIIINPYWSAFTEAYSKLDYGWMKNEVMKLRRVIIVVCIIVIFSILISNFAYKFWIGDIVFIPFLVTISLGAYFIVISIVSLHTNILNGTGKIKLQLIVYLFGAVLHIPTAIFFGNLFGIVGVVMSATFYFGIIAIFSIMQVNKVINKEAKGIWNT